MKTFGLAHWHCEMKDGLLCPSRAVCYGYTLDEADVMNTFAGQRTEQTIIYRSLHHHSFQSCVRFYFILALALANTHTHTARPLSFVPFSFRSLHFVRFLYRFIFRFAHSFGRVFALCWPPLPLG